MDCICLTMTRPSGNISHPTQIDLSNSCFQSLGKVIKTFTLSKSGTASISNIASVQKRMILMGNCLVCLNIRPKDAAVFGDRVTPNMATYAFLFCHYGCKGAMCTK